MPHRVEYASSRRDFFLRAGLGFGSLALGAMLSRGENVEYDPIRPLAPRILITGPRSIL